MSKAVMISIQPKWCEKIASGKKTIEVRKTRPKTDVPFKCYIYQTKLRWVYTLLHALGFFAIARRLARGVGKVIGEFVCDEIIEFYEETLAHDELDGNPVEAWMMWNMSDNLCEVLHLYEMEDVERCTCLTSAEILSYLHPNMNGYGWHISDLVIYDEPKEILSFSYPCKEDCDTCKYNRLNPWANSIEPVMMCQRDVTKAPQSWCYVEELK